jgi:hypothetical protein
VWRGAEEVHAECTSGLHDAPAERCHCGLNAWHQFGKDWDASEMVGGVVIGRGAVRVHWDGWRAEYARPAALVFGAGSVRNIDLDPATRALSRDGSEEQLVRALAAKIGVPAVAVAELEAFVSFLDARPVPEALRPAPPSLHVVKRGVLG